MKRSLVVIAAFAALGVAASACDGACCKRGETATVAQAAAEKTKDPVCGMEVDTAKAEKATHEGKTYHFCSRVCKEKFEKDPAKYTKKAPQKG